jgi:hypothetical protein
MENLLGRDRPRFMMNRLLPGAGLLRGYHQSLPARLAQSYVRERGGQPNVLTKGKNRLELVPGRIREHESCHNAERDFFSVVVSVGFS